MADPAAATATQLRNIETRTGLTLAQLRRTVVESGMTRHSDVRSLLTERYGLGHGDANTLAHAVRAEPPTGADPLDAIYAGNKAALRALHDSVLAQVNSFGAFDIAPKKTYVSLRRRKQFATVGPATQTQLEIGLNATGLPAHARLKVIAPGGMCQYAVRLSAPSEVDARLLGWLRTAFDAAG